MVGLCSHLGPSTLVNIPSVPPGHGYRRGPCRVLENVWWLRETVMSKQEEREKRSAANHGRAEAP